MQTYMLEKPQEKAFSVRFEPKSENFNALLVVYEVNEGEWRGFAHPYGETIEASSKKEAIKNLRVLTIAYYNSIKHYGFPTHLVNGGLRDVMDRKVFSWVVGNKDFMERVHSKIGKADSTYCYVEAYRAKP